MRTRQRVTAPSDPMWDDVINPRLGRPMHWDRAGRPISLRQWVERNEDFRYKRVGMDYVRGTRVSTVWLGLDHGFGPGEPIIFETMVFSRQLSRFPEGGPLAGSAYHEPVFDELQVRYGPEAQARAGHYAIRKIVRRELQRRNGPPPLKARPKRSRRR